MNSIRRPKERTRPAANRVKRHNNHPSDQLVMGRNCLLEILAHNPGRLSQVLLSAGDGRLSDELAQIQAMAGRNGIQIRIAEKAELTDITRSDSHQGCVGVLKSRGGLSLEDLSHIVEKERHVLLLLVDNVQDPQNLGSLLRAAECFGVDAVIWSKNRGPSVTPVVAKASVGACELVPYCQVANLADCVRKLKDMGIWIVSAELSPGAKEVSQFEFPEKCAILVGSEGEGVSRLLSSLSDYQVAIGMSGKIQSLNVSQAASVLLYAASRQRGA